MTQRKTCKDCGIALILREHDNPIDPIHEEAEYEDGMDVCGNCSCGDNISRTAIERNQQ